MTEKYKITNVQLFDYANEIQTGETEYEMQYSYSANVVINDDFIIQISGNKDESMNYFPASDEIFWSTAEKQDFASENYNVDEIVNQITIDGLELNLNSFVSELGAEIMLPKNAQYRINGI